MDPFGNEAKDSRSTTHPNSTLSSSPNSTLFPLPLTTPNSGNSSTAEPLFTSVDSVLSPGLGFSDFGGQAYQPPLNFGFSPLDTLGTSEQFTEQELAELDEYLNSLSQQGVNESPRVQLPVSNGAPLGGFEYPDNFSQAASSGTHLYQDALNQWSSSYDTTYQPVPLSESPAHVYSPFGSSAFAYGETNSPTSTTIHNSYQEVKPEPINVKPSFAEVAKNKPSKPIEKIYLHRQGSNNEKPDHLSIPTYHTSTKGKRVKCVRPGSHNRNRCTPVTPPTEIKPDSRYGLDTFDETSTDKQNKTLSRENSRKNSTSSISSTMSGEDKESVHSDGGRTSHNAAGIGSREKKIHRTRIDSGGEKPFFDPRRIFQEAQDKRQVETNNEDFVPNNKQKIQPEKDKDKAKASVKSGSTKYINNDLRDTKKNNNIEQENVSSTQSNHVESDMHRRPIHEPSTRAKPKKLEVISNGVRERAPRREWGYDRAKYIIGQWMRIVWEWMKWLLKEVGVFLWNLATLVFSVFLLLMALLLHYALTFVLKIWSFIKEKIPFFNKNEARYEWSKDLGSQQHRQKQFGLKENIILPSTGDEAMRRLLSCKGKDPYSILGVRGDASDDDIKKYYRKQAFLVHPDKNKQPGAEESFKILGHAFDLLGTPEKRTEYDSQYDKSEAEAAMQEFSDLLGKLNDKMQEAANLLRCDQCGGKHKRVPTDRPMYCARFCDRCNTRHPAKEGDVWAESTMLGFLWHYYACMEGKVYDITEWAKCKRENFKSLQANAHQVIYRLTTTGGRPRHAQRTGEADLEDFLNNLFHSTASSSTVPGDPNATSSQTPAPPPQNNTGAKKGRKKKKKH